MLKPFNFWRAKTTCAAAAFCLALCSCDIVSFEALQTSVSVGEAQNFYDSESVALGFSIAVNPLFLQTAISLREDGKTCAADVCWQGAACLVKAAGGFKKGAKYALTLNGAVVTLDGRSYPVDIFREFIFGKESEMFYIQSVQEPNKNDSQSGPLILRFNKAVNPAVFEREFNVTPSAALKKEFSEDKSCVKIFPAEKWKANVYYSWRLENAQSLDGVKISRQTQGSFMGAQKAAAPKIVCVCPVLQSGAFDEQGDLTALAEQQKIGAVFDCEMNFESLKKGAYWSPLLEGYWTQIDGRRFVWNPSQNYNIQSEYTLCLSDSIEDAFGLALDRRSDFCVKSRADFIKLKVFCASKSGQGAQAFESVELEQNKINSICLPYGANLLVTLCFSTPLDAKSVEGAKNAASLQAHFPVNAKTPNLDSITLAGGDRTQIQFEWSGFDFADSSQEPIYLLKVKGGANFIYNERGERLKEDACFYIVAKES